MSEIATGEMGTPTKPVKASTSQEPLLSTQSPMPYQEWAAAFQAYYPSGMNPLPPPGYFTSTGGGSGPQHHPYMWGGQPLVPPYGFPPPYGYAPGGIYSHPSMPPGAQPYSPYNMTAGTLTDVQGAAADAENKTSNGKSKNKAKKCKTGLASKRVVSVKGTEQVKANSALMNGGLSQSGESGSDGSTKGSEDCSQNDSQGVHRGSTNQITSQAPLYHGTGQDISAGHAAVATPLSIGGKQAVGAGPLTNLNIGMDYWSGGPQGFFATTCGKQASNVNSLFPCPNMMVPGRDELCLQDEKELKRQRRKQSNRESARRSRMRKQAECEELQVRVDTLTKENVALREELNRITEECNKLAEENNSLLERLQMPRPLSLNGKIDHNSELPPSDGSRKTLQMEDETVEREAEGANESLSLTGSSSEECTAGNLAVSSN